MPRKRIDGKITGPDGGELKFVRLELSVPRHTELRIEAAKQGVTMATLARTIVHEYLDARRE